MGCGVARVALKTRCLHGVARYMHAHTAYDADVRAALRSL